jgi:hypothetical protein
MLDETGNPMTPGQLELALRGVYETIARMAGTTQGRSLHRLEARQPPPGQPLPHLQGCGFVAVLCREVRAAAVENQREAIDPGRRVFDAMISTFTA